MVSPARKEARAREQIELEERDALGDVPAAVVCALCGDSDCPGCGGDRSRSGVVSRPFDA